MFTIKTKLDKSDIQGIGVFADEDVSKGDVVWKYHSILDITMSVTDVEVQDETIKNYLKKYAYLDVNDNHYYLCGDNARFTNHSDDPNVITFTNEIQIAVRDIKKGEEITESYYTYDSDAKLKLSIN